MNRMTLRHQPFAFASSDELREKARSLGCGIPFQDDISPLFQPLAIGGRTVRNRLAVQPMEGCDAGPDGSPGELTFRRYRRYAEGGSALIWFEATSVAAEGRSNPRQLFLHRGSLDGFKRLVETVRAAAGRAFGASGDVFCVLQLTHSGRYSRPRGEPRPRVGSLNTLLDSPFRDVRLLGDDELDRLQDDFMAAGLLAVAAGFDAVDIKACHGYLVHDLLTARERKNSRYGGSLDNRMSFLTGVVRRIRAEVPVILTAVRLSAYDGLPCPPGFGAAEDGSPQVELSEPRQVLDKLVEKDCSLVNITAGIPAFNPHLGRPFDRPLPGAEPPDEHPLQGVDRLLRLTAGLQKSLPGLPLVGTGYSWLRRFWPHVGASVVARGGAALIGLGRSSFAYPDAPRDLMDRGKVDPNRVCIACSRCTELLRGGRLCGCPVRDREVYGREYRSLTGRDAVSD